MSNYFIPCHSFNEGYLRVLNCLRRRATPRKGTQNGTVYAVNNVTIQLKEPRKCVLSLPFRGMSRKYAAGELITYLRGTDEPDVFSYYSKFWTNILNGEGKVNSAYGKRMFAIREKANTSRWAYALQCLLENPDTKNAVISMRDDSDIVRENQKDTCCTLALCFYVENGALNLRAIMRSQDAWRGLPYDVFCFAQLLQIMLYQYNANKAKSAPALTLGVYEHQMLNVHLYEKHWQKLCDYTGMFLKPEKAYSFPEYTQKSADNMAKLFEFEQRLRLRDLTPEEFAAVVREQKLDPFTETLASYLVNKITDCAPTKFEQDMFARAEKEAAKSACIDRKVGCVITDKEGNVLGIGHNAVYRCNQKCDDKAHRVCDVTHGEICALNSVDPRVNALIHTAYVTLYPCRPCMMALKKAGVQYIKVRGFSHKCAVDDVLLYDEEFFTKQ